MSPHNRDVAGPSAPSALDVPDAAAVEPLPRPAPESSARAGNGRARPPRRPGAPDLPARDGDRSLRDLVGAGPTQLSPGRAARARDADRPSAAELAEAERGLVIVRRHWTPDGRAG